MIILYEPSLLLFSQAIFFRTQANKRTLLKKLHKTEILVMFIGAGVAQSV
jgi:hypothetical protein